VKMHSGARLPRGTPGSAAPKTGSTPSVTSMPKRRPASVAILGPSLSAVLSRGCAAIAAAKVHSSASTPAPASARVNRPFTLACGAHGDGAVTAWCRVTREDRVAGRRRQLARPRLSLNLKQAASPRSWPPSLEVPVPSPTPRQTLLPGGPRGRPRARPGTPTGAAPRRGPTINPGGAHCDRKPGRKWPRTEDRGRGADQTKNDPGPADRGPGRLYTQSSVLSPVPRPGGPR